LHRDNGPAFEHYTGSKTYHQNGELHRLDGPARIINGEEQWWIHDVRLTPKSLEILIRFFKNHRIRKMLRVEKNEAFWQWYMDPDNIGGIKAKKETQTALNNIEKLVPISKKRKLPND